MKNISLLALSLSCFLSSFGQRYLTDDFPVLDSIIGGIYGTSVDYQSNTQELLFDFYEPANDTLDSRPLIIYIHGGGFNTGTRTYPSVRMLCRRMANKGYTVANIDYRLDPDFDIYNSTDDRRAMTDAMHDAKQAIRYFKANALTYGIDTAQIFIGGESAGAATSMMAAFINKQSEMASYPMANPNNPIGSEVNSEFGSNVCAAMCLCGLLLDTTAIEFPTDPSILWTHGTEDDFVPISLALNIVVRATNVGLPIQTKIYEGGVHCPWYFGNPNWATYLDSTVMDITSFLYPKVSTVAVTYQDTENTTLSIYPNPFQSKIYVDLKGTDLLNRETKITLLTSLGLHVFEQTYLQTESKIPLNLEFLDLGMYFIVVENGTQRIVWKLIKN